MGSMNFRVNINTNKEKASKESKRLSHLVRSIVVTTVIGKIKNLENLY